MKLSNNLQFNEESRNKSYSEPGNISDFSRSSTSLSSEILLPTERMFTGQQFIVSDLSARALNGMYQ